MFKKGGGGRQAHKGTAVKQVWGWLGAKHGRNAEGGGGCRESAIDGVRTKGGQKG